MKQRLNFIINIIMFLLLAAITGIGFLMKYVLIPGKERFVKYGDHVDLYFMGWDRHEWGTVHLILGFAMLALLALHIILHWKTVACMFRLLIHKRAWRIMLTVAFSVFCLFLLAFAFIVNIELRDTGAGQGLQHRHGSVPDTLDSTIRRQAEPSRLEGKSQHIHGHPGRNVHINGSMTLQEISDTYQIPLDSIITGLGIDPSCSPHEKLGRLRKHFSFSMTDVENIVNRLGSKPPRHN